MNSTRMKAFTAAIAGVSAVLLMAAPSQAAGNKCRATVAKESAKLTQAIAKTLQKCEAGRLKGKILTTCALDSKTGASIQKSKDKLTGALGKACTNAVGQFALALCPAADGGTGPGTCTSIKISDNTSIGQCLGCLADENARELLSTVTYSNFITSSDKAISKCQDTIGKNTAAFYITKSKLLAKCQASVLGGKITGPCPDTATATAIQAAEDKKVAAIAKTCCGPDGSCGGGQCSNSPANRVVRGCTGAGVPAACCTGLGTGPTCDNTACTSNTCAGGTNAGANCTVASECPSGSCAGGHPLPWCTGAGQGTAGTNSDCTGSGTPKPCCTGLGTGNCVGFDFGTSCEQTRGCFRCIAGPVFGLECQTNGECGAGGRCANGLCAGGTSAGQMCERTSDCPGAGSTCHGGTNNGASCTVASECPGGGQCGNTCDKTGTASLCSGGANNGNYCLLDADCVGGTCNKSGTSYCTSDDYRPVQDLGFIDPCPGLNVGAGPIGGTVMGQTMESLLECVDKQAADRADCQDKAGATFNTGSLPLPGRCSKVIDDCTSNGGTVVATVSVTATPATPLGGVAVSLGFPYTKVQLPGAGSDATPLVAVTQTSNPTATAFDSGDTVSVSAQADINNLESFSNGALLTVTFTTCGASPAVSADFPCVVQSASDTSGNAIVEGVTCSASVP
jgi:hypothetical protein